MLTIYFALAVTLDSSVLSRETKFKKENITLALQWHLNNIIYCKHDEIRNIMYEAFALDGSNIIYCKQNTALT